MVSGVERTDEFVVDDQLLTDVGGTLGFSVLSTPGMIAMMERCSAMLAFDQLSDGQATVGFEVCVKHVAGAGQGARCTVTAKLDRVEDSRKFFFDGPPASPAVPQVKEGDRVIGVGTHQRRVVNRG